MLYEAMRFVRAQISIRRRLISLGLLAAGCFLALLPWTLRNYVELGAPVISRDNLGRELYVSNNDDAWPTLEDNAKHALFRQRHPNLSLKEARLVQQLGEVRYNRVKKAEALAWIKTHPKRFIKLAVRRYSDFWVETLRGNVLPVYWMAMLVAGLTGLWLCWYEGKGNVLLFGVLLVLFSIPHLFIEAGYRYRYPLNVVLLLYAGFFITRLAAVERSIASTPGTRRENLAMRARPEATIP
jgi:hypothetical protein